MLAAEEETKERAVESADAVSTDNEATDTPSQPEDIADMFSEDDIAGAEMFSDGEQEPIQFTDDFLDGPTEEPTSDPFEGFGDLDDDFLAGPTPTEETPVEETAVTEAPKRTAQEQRREEKPCGQVHPVRRNPICRESQVRNSTYPPETTFSSVRCKFINPEDARKDDAENGQLFSHASPNVRFRSDLSDRRAPEWTPGSNQSASNNENGESEFKFINVKERYGDRDHSSSRVRRRELMDPAGTSWWLVCLRSFSEPAC